MQLACLPGCVIPARLAKLGKLEPRGRVEPYARQIQSGVAHAAIDRHVSPAIDHLLLRCQVLENAKHTHAGRHSERGHSANCSPCPPPNRKTKMQDDGHGSRIWHPKWNPVNGIKDQNLRSPGGSIWTHGPFLLLMHSSVTRSRLGPGARDKARTTETRGLSELFKKLVDIPYMQRALPALPARSAMQRLFHFAARLCP